MHLLSGLALSLAAGAAALQLPIRPSEGASQPPMRSNWGRTHAQFTFTCYGCFSQATEEEDEEDNGVFVDDDIDFKISRPWGIDGASPACSINGQRYDEAQFDRNIADEYLDVDAGQTDAPAVIIYPRGDLVLHTLVANATHDIKGVSYTVHYLRDTPNVYPRQPSGFRLSYMRRPVPKILRIEPAASNFSDVEEWINPPPSQRFDLVEHPAIDEARDVYGWLEDYYWLECETVVCHVNRWYELIKKARAECVDRVEHPENWEFDEDELPMHCYLYLNPRYVMVASSLCVVAVSAALNRLIRRIRGRRYRRGNEGRYWQRKEKR